MKVSVHNVYSQSERTFNGSPEQVVNQLKLHYTFLRRYKDVDTLQEILQKLSEQQALFVSVEE